MDIVIKTTLRKTDYKKNNILCTFRTDDGQFGIKHDFMLQFQGKKIKKM